MWVAKLLLGVGGIALLFNGCNESHLRSKSGPAPVERSLAELEANGPGNNAWITLTDFLAIDWNYVYVERSGRRGWEEVWIPVVPLDGEFALGPYAEACAEYDRTGEWPEPAPLPDQIHSLIRIPNVSGEEEVSRRVGADKLTGMVLTTVTGLGTDERRLLEDGYASSVDLGNAAVFDVGRRPLDAGLIRVMQIAGVVMLSLLGFWLWREYGTQSPGRRPRRTGRRIPPKRRPPPPPRAVPGGSNRRR